MRRRWFVSTVARRNEKTPIDCFVRHSKWILARRRRRGFTAFSLGERERWKDVVRVCDLAAETNANPDESVGFWLQAARGYVRRLDDGQNGAERYKKVLSLRPNNDEALRFLVDHYNESESWDALVEVYEQVLRHEQSPEVEQGSIDSIGDASLADT